MAGRRSFSVLLAQDIAVIPMLALICRCWRCRNWRRSPHGAADAAHGVDEHGARPEPRRRPDRLADRARQSRRDRAGDRGGSRLTEPLFRFISAANLRELFTATALMLVIGIALLMSLVGLSAPRSARSWPAWCWPIRAYRHELESDIDPFKGLLLGLFFMTVGAGIDFGLLGTRTSSSFLG
jgi:CPA2 family monovalent cation:H+ antiporter-2